MNHKRLASLLLVATIAVSGCDESTPAPSTGSTPPAAVAPTPTADPAPTAEPSKGEREDLISTFPKKLADYKFKSAKTKTHDWGTAYSATYESGGKELKVVINDAPPKGVAAWDAFFTEPKDMKGFPSAIDAKPDKGKITLMVRVKERFRVDFKTREAGVDLEKAARNFPYQKL